MVKRNTPSRVPWVIRAIVVMSVVIATADLATAVPVVQYTYQGETGGLIIGLHTSVPGYQNGYYFAVGQFDMTTSSAGWTSPLLTYCTDVGSLLTSPHNYSPYTIPPAQLGVNPTWVSGGIQKAAALFYLYNNSSTTADQKAGLQMAIWEALYNTKASYAGADFFSNANNAFYIQNPYNGNLADVNAAASYAASVLDNVLGLSPSQLTADDAHVLWLAPVEGNTITGSQGLLYPAKVPDACSSLALLGIAVTTLGIARRKLRAA